MTKKHRDLSTKTIALAFDDEQILYRRDLNDGKWLRSKIIVVYMVTNYRIVTMSGDPNNPTIPNILLEQISDVVAINQHREYQGGHKGTRVSAGRGMGGLSYTVGGHRGKSIEYGDIVISSPATDDQIWGNISDCDSVVRLIKSQVKTRKQQLGGPR